MAEIRQVNPLDTNINYEEKTEKLIFSEFERESAYETVKKTE